MPASTLVFKTALSVAALLVCTWAGAQAPAPQAKVELTDSNAARLAGNKRVAITNVLLSFQASTGGEKTNTSGLFANKTDTSATLQMPVFDLKLLAAISDDIYQQLRDDLQANGYEVLPEATVLASPGYQKITALAGISNYSKFANMDGDVMLVGASGLKPYLPYNAETGKFSVQLKTLIKDWVSGWGQKSSTEGGPSNTRTGEIYELPGLEVALAKELNAHIVKASYVITLGSTKAATTQSYQPGERQIAYTVGPQYKSREQRDKEADKIISTYKANAYAQVGLLAGQSRIAFRTAAASPKGESAPGGYTANFGKSASPAKDGDVVVTLAESLLGGTESFYVEAPAQKERGLMGALLGTTLGGTGADVQFVFTSAIADPTAYHAEVLGLVKLAQRDMLSLVKQ
ncbi:hypothetical protein [Roseateles oligotrophus]|uniref:Uncharacterized protein n=1 Tax=Roseateles oligotrophus TaxID=1769250 RepID=A0ABT2YIC5_9BURK|nr:hypothetical protein [Roseateles oligotrophus]MCV2369819.1 hypothetical protein [Roseateles oligotrophus]